MAEEEARWCGSQGKVQEQEVVESVWWGKLIGHSKISGRERTCMQAFLGIHVVELEH